MDFGNGKLYYGKIYMQSDVIADKLRDRNTDFDISSSIGEHDPPNTQRTLIQHVIWPQGVDKCGFHLCRCWHLQGLEYGSQGPIEPNEFRQMQQHLARHQLQSKRQEIISTFPLQHSLTTGILFHPQTSNFDMPRNSSQNSHQHSFGQHPNSS